MSRASDNIDFTVEFISKITGDNNPEHHLYQEIRGQFG